MPTFRFTTAADWLTALEHRLADAEQQRLLGSRRMPLPIFRSVAAAEVAAATPTGAVTASASELARVTGCDEHMVTRVRVGLINMGMQVFLEPLSPGTAVRRQLQIPRDIAVEQD